MLSIKNSNILKTSFSVLLEDLESVFFLTKYEESLPRSTYLYLGVPSFSFFLRYNDVHVKCL